MKKTETEQILEYLKHIDESINGPRTKAPPPKHKRPLSDRMDSVEKKVDSLDTKVDTLDTKVDDLDTKVDTLDKKFVALDTKVDKLDTRVSEVQLGLATLAANTKARFAEGQRAFRELSTSVSEGRRAVPDDRRAVRQRRQAIRRRRPKHRDNPRSAGGSREAWSTTKLTGPDRRSGSRAGRQAAAAGADPAAAACPWRLNPSLLSRCAAARSGGTAWRASGSGCRQGTARRRCQSRRRSRT